MKKRIYIFASKFENLNPSGESMWRDRGNTTFVIELDESLLEPIPPVNLKEVITKLLESKTTNVMKYFYESHEIETTIPEMLATQEIYLSALNDI